MWYVQLGQPNHWTHVEVSHCATVAQAVRTAQRAYPGWTVLVAERIGP